MTATATRADIRGKSFAWLFGVALGLFLSGALCDRLAVTRSLPALRWVGAGLLILAGIVPLALQLRIGFSLDRSWVARYSRSTEPTRYWVSILLGALVVAFWAYGAISFARM